MTRRDQCYFIGRRAKTCNDEQAAYAWINLAFRLEAMGENDIPKFRDLIHAIRLATIAAKQENRSSDEILRCTKFKCDQVELVKKTAGDSMQTNNGHFHIYISGHYCPNCGAGYG